MLTPELESTLKAVGQVMAQAEDDWWVIAGAAAALHGVGDPPVGDVDVLVSDRDLASLCERLCLSVLAPSPHPLFASRGLARWTEPALTVEWMAGFRVQSKGQWHAVQPTTRDRFLIGDSEVFVPSSEELVGLLTLIGRPKDLVRAERLLGEPRAL